MGAVRGHGGGRSEEMEDDSLATLEEGTAKKEDIL